MAAVDDALFWGKVREAHDMVSCDHSRFITVREGTKEATVVWAVDDEAVIILVREVPPPPPPTLISPGH